jgi:hypothetical protein
MLGVHLHREFECPRRDISSFWGIVAGLAVLTALVPLRQVWAVSVIQVALLFSLPGIAALRALRIPSDSISAMPLYIPAASTIIVMLGGLAADLIGHGLGVHQPLQGPYPVLAIDGLSLSCALSALATRSSTSTFESIRWPRLTPARVLPLALPAMAAAGALLLNNGRGPGVARIGELAIAAALALAFVLRGRLSPGTMAVIIFSAALAAMWAFSLRSDSVLGFDISTEYHVATTTQHSGYWHPLQRGDAYAAMLSITVMPAVLSSVAGVSVLVAFKVLFPVFTALIPVAVYFMARRVVSGGYALGAASVILGQSYFFQEMPQLARQELALLEFAVLCVALSRTDIARGARARLATLFSIGVVLSHYSSAYVAIVIMVIASGIQIASCVLPYQRRIASEILVAAAALVIGAGVWYGAVTHSASNVNEFTSTVAQKGLDLFPTAKSAGGLVSAYLGGNVSTAVRAQRYERLVSAYVHQHQPYIHPAPGASSPKYQLASAAVPVAPVRSAQLATAERDVIVVIGQVMLLLGGLGAVLLWLRPAGTPVERTAGILAAATVPTLAILRFSGTVAQSYNQERALLQSLILLAIPAAWLAAQVMKRAWVLRPVLKPIAAASLILLFLYNSGSTTLALGGGRSVNISQSGEDFERLYVTAPELASATWVNGEAGSQLVFADRYGQLRLFQGAGRPAFQYLTPIGIDRNGWVYASRTNVVLGRARGQVDSFTATYGFPRAFLNEKFSLVFNDGQSEVFH